MESPPPAGAPANRPAPLLLKALVLVGAVTFLATMMINLCARPPEAFYPTKAAPVMRSLLLIRGHTVEQPAVTPAPEPQAAAGAAEAAKAGAALHVGDKVGRRLFPGARGRRAACRPEQHE